jgi:predicted RNA-binding protein
MDSQPDLIANIYKTVSQIIETLNADNANLNLDVSVIKAELIDVKRTLQKLQYNINSSRNALIQTIDNNVKNIKVDIEAIKDSIKEEKLRETIKSIIETDAYIKK